jgi:flagellar hook protein FlgE
VSSQSQDGFARASSRASRSTVPASSRACTPTARRSRSGSWQSRSSAPTTASGRAGQNLWIETRDSGTAALGGASTGGRASVSAGALESSNVDLGEEFVGLIQHQRSFSANSKTITTADEMLQELINIKR